MSIYVCSWITVVELVSYLQLYLKDTLNIYEYKCPLAHVISSTIMVDVAVIDYHNNKENPIYVGYR